MNHVLKWLVFVLGLLVYCRPSPSLKYPLGTEEQEKEREADECAQELATLVFLQIRSNPDCGIEPASARPAICAQLHYLLYNTRFACTGDSGDVF